jgi:transcriptional regulator with XRE-family HTH domain
MRVSTFGDAVAAEVRAIMARRRITGESVAAHVGKSRGYVSRRLIGETCFDVDDLDAVATALGVPLEAILEPAIAELRRARDASGVHDDVAAAPTEGSAEGPNLTTLRRQAPNAEKCC